MYIQFSNWERKQHLLEKGLELIGMIEILFTLYVLLTYRLLKIKWGYKNLLQYLKRIYLFWTFLYCTFLMSLYSRKKCMYMVVIYIFSEWGKFLSSGFIPHCSQFIIHKSSCCLTLHDLGSWIGYQINQKSIICLNVCVSGF